MFEGFTRTEIATSGARIHLRHGGDGPPLLLLHGNPLTHVSWHKVASRLAEHFHVVAADLRGYGDSVGPEEGAENHVNYSFRAMAQDQVEIMEQLGYREFFATGHDRGARTIHRMCLDHPERVKRAAVIDILPNYHIWTHASKNWAMKSWHWLFMAQPYDMPERMMAGVPAQWFMEKKLSKPGIGLGFFDPEAFAEYVRCFNWKTIRGSCEDYRACATCDFEMDEADRKAGRKVGCPLLVVWGRRATPARCMATCSRCGGITPPRSAAGRSIAATTYRKKRRRIHCGGCYATLAKGNTPTSSHRRRPVPMFDMGPGLRREDENLPVGFPTPPHR